MNPKPNSLVDSNQENIKELELADIEDIIPSGANSLFLSCARVLINMSNKNQTFTNALKECCGITTNDLKCDLKLQNLLRKKLCQYLSENSLAVKENNICYLKDEYNKSFNGNIYDFLIQVYQLSINNFSNNLLYRKFAISNLCQILQMKINFKKTNGQWKTYEPKQTQSTSTDPNIKQYLNYLNSCVIYLHEFRHDSSSHLTFKKTIRYLLNKKQWCKNYSDNVKICLNFAQFNDPDELKAYQKLAYSISSNQLMKSLGPIENLNETNKLFHAFISHLPIDILVSASFNQNKNINHEMELNDECNSVGKQIIRFESMGGSQKLKEYFSYLLYGKKITNDNDSLNSQLSIIIN